MIVLNFLFQRYSCRLCVSSLSRTRRVELDGQNQTRAPVFECADVMAFLGLAKYACLSLSDRSVFQRCLCSALLFFPHTKMNVNRL